MAEIRVVIYEDNEKLRSSLKQIINIQPGFKVVADFGHCLNIKENIPHLHPQIIVMDIDLPGINGVEGVKIIKHLNPEISIIMYTVFDDDDRLFQSLCAGANGYLLKKGSLQNLMDGLRDIPAGGAPLSPEMAQKILKQFYQRIPPANHFDLSSREKEILNYLVKGFTYKKIAAACYISLDTVRKHLQNIYAKLHVNCGTEAVAKALKYKIVD